MPIYERYTVPTSAPLVLRMSGNRPPISIRMIPGASGTLLAETSLTPSAGATDVTPTWVQRTGGAVSSTTDDTIASPITALRFTAATSAGTVEICA